MNLPVKTQEKAAKLFIGYGGNRNKYLAKAIHVTGKRAHKLLKRARRQIREVQS